MNGKKPAPDETKSIASKAVFHSERAIKTSKEKGFSDYLSFNSIAMDSFQAANYAISLGEKLIESGKLGVPMSYRDVFDILFKRGKIEKSARNALVRLVYLRNVIAHQYGEVGEGDVKEAVFLLSHAKKFAEKYL